MKILNYLLAGLLFFSTGAMAQSPVQWGPYVVNPFNTFNITTGATYSVSNLNSFYSTVLWNSSTASNKSLTIPTCDTKHQGYVLNVLDAIGTASTYSITITPTSGTIGLAGTKVITVNSAEAQLVCNSSVSDWTINNAAEMFPDASNNLPIALTNLTNAVGGPTYYAKNYGACVWDSAHDVGPCINAAITTALNTVVNVGGFLYGGATIQLPAGNYGLATTVLQTAETGISVVGAAGPGNFGVCQTQLTWTGAAASTMFQMGVDGETHPVVGGGLQNICLNGNSLAGTGVKLRSADYGFYKDVFIKDVTSNGWDLNPASGDLAGGLSFNTFIDTKVSLGSGSAINANGWLLGTGSAANDSFANYWVHPLVQYQNGIGFSCQDADTNRVTAAFIQAINGGSGISLDLGASGVAGTETCRSNFFDGSFGNGAGTAPVAETGAFPSVNNVLRVNLGSGQLVPVINGSATLTYSTIMGNYYSNAATTFQQGSLGFNPAGTLNHASFDIDTTNAANFATIAKFGSSLPMYLMYSNPAVGFNAYWQGGGNFAYGKGSAGNYAGLLNFNPTTGSFTFNCTTATGNADAVATLSACATLDKTGNFKATGTVLLASYTVGTLPTCNAGSKGAMAYVTDATAPTYNATLTGLGAVIVPVFCNGSAWTSH